MVTWVVEFLKEGYKIRTIFGRKLISSKEIITYIVLINIVASRQENKLSQNLIQKRCF